MLFLGCQACLKLSDSAEHQNFFILQLCVDGLHAHVLVGYRLKAYLYVFILFLGKVLDHVELLLKLTYFNGLFIVAEKMS